MADTEFPYTTSPPGLKRIMEGTPKWGTPDKVTGAWLDGVGFKGGSAARSLGVLRTIGVVDSSGKPTELWAALRGKDRVKFADGLRKHYSGLFATYSDANRKDTEALIQFVRSKTDYAESVQKLAVRTFKTVCEFGDFDADAPDDADDDEVDAKPKGKASKAKAQQPAGGGVALTVNLQLQLPPSESGEVYDKLFAAMAKHLKGLIGTE
jgi:hypothetical protein